MSQATTRRRAFGTLLLPLLVGALEPRLARGAGKETVDLRYDLSLNGFRVAEIVVGIAPAGVADSSALAARLVVRSSGLASWFHRSTVTLDSIAEMTNHGAEPVRYNAREDKSDRTREIAIRYGRGGEITSVSYLKSGQPGAIEVPPELRVGTVDPVTAFLRLRAWLPEARRKGTGANITVPVFDGRKRMDFEARYAGRQEINLRRDKAAADEIHLVFLARYGFTANDPLVAFPGDANPRWLRVYASVAEDPVPLHVQSVNARNQLIVELASDCRVAAACG